MSKRNRPIDWDDIHPDGLEGVLKDSPKEASLQEIHKILNGTRFISQLIKLNGKPTRIIRDLNIILDCFPEYVWVEVKDNILELCFKQKEIKKIIESSLTDYQSDILFGYRIIFPSFERGLKHMGLTVVESTHGVNTIKKWRLK